MMLIEDMMNWLLKESLFGTEHNLMWKLLTTNDWTGEEKEVNWGAGNNS
jgi:hypothetical protein